MSFQPPPTYVGQIVLHKRGFGDQPSAAIITQLGNEVVCLARIDPAMVNILPHDGVRHQDDPRAQRSIDEKDGIWCHLDEDKHFQQYAAYRLAAVRPSKNKSSE